MANSKVVFEVVATSKGLKVVAKDIDKTSKATDKLAKSQDRASRSGDRFDKQNKSLYQSNLSSAKSFSKMNQTIGGEGGSGALVGSYAILAANVFAVSAAFNALRGAMQVEKLAEGLQTFSNQAGISLDLVSRRLQEATGYAVSLEQAMTTAALSTSAGFGVAEMEGLTRVAKGASQALGRDMGDALDRLTRGAIKLEPEILDELGIMVRLDDATETYATTLGKTASSLTRFERQQAFMNAIITEGEMKFGAIADSIEPNVYDQLAAAFADLAKDMLQLINGPLGFLIEFFLQAKVVFLGLVGVFAGSIVKKMIPAFGNMARSAIVANQAAKEAIEQSIKAGSAQAAAARKQISATKEMPEAFKKVAGSIKDGTATTQQMTTAQQQLTRSINKYGDVGTKEYERLNKTQKKLVDKMVQQRALIINIKKESAGTGGQRAFDLAQANLKLSEDELDIMTESEKQTFSLAGTKDKYLKILNMTKKATGTYFRSLLKANGITKKSNIITKIYRMTLAGLRSGFKFAAISAKVFGKALLGAIPIIGQIIMVLGIVWDVIKRVAKMFGFFSEESAKAKDAMKDLDGVIKDIPNKIKEMADQQERAMHTSTLMTNNYRQMGGLLKTINEETRRAMVAQAAAGKLIEDAEEGGPKAGSLSDSSVRIKARKDARFAGAAGIEAMGGEAAAALKKALGGQSVLEFLQAKEDTDGLGNALKELFNISLDVEERFGGVGQAAANLKSTFGEAEKEASKFMLAVQPATEFDGVARNMDALVNGLNSLREEASSASSDLTTLIGENAQGMGTSTALLLGPEVFDSYDKLSKKNAEIIEARRKASFLTGKDKEEAEAAIKIQEKEYETLRKQLGTQINLNAETRKGLVDNLKAQAVIFKQREKKDKEIMKRAKAIDKSLTTSVALEKVQQAIRDDEVINLQKKQELLQASYDTALAATDPSEKQKEAILIYNETAQKIAILEAQRVDKTVQLKEIALDNLQILQRQVAEQNQLFQVATEVAKLEQEASVRRARGGNAESTKSETAELEMRVAEEAYNLAIETSAIRMDIIEAEHELLKAKTDVEVELNKLEIAKETGADGKLTKRGEALTALNTALQNSVNVSARSMKMQEKIAELTVTKAGLTLQKATSDVLANLGNVFTQSGGGEGLAAAFEIVFGNAMIRATERKIADIQGLIDAEMAKPEKDRDQGLLDTLNKQKTTAEGDLDTQKKAQEDISTVDKVGNALSGMGTMIEEMFGEEGAVVSAFAFMGSTFIENLDKMGEGFSAFTAKSEEEAESSSSKYEKMAAGLDGLGAVMSSIAALASASGKQKVAAIDKEIAAEKKRDGKSKESLAKIAALEKKKEATEKKNFERNKKMQMAMTIINTASAVMKAAAEGNVFKAIAMAVFGAAQLAIISKTQFNSSSQGAEAASAPQSIGIGKRDNRVDVSKGTSAGELSYLRGERGMGSSATSFIPGGAAGYKSYAGGTGEAVIVGEQGPEMVKPSGPYEVIPNDKMGGQNLNANITINAIDAAGVEEVLTAQKGNIIGMIREAAHEHGEEFIESVNPASYGGGTGG